MSVFESVGFPVYNKRDYENLIKLAAKSGRRTQSENGGYIAWSPGPGLQLWVFTNSQGVMEGCHPHFQGASSLPVHVESLTPGVTLLEGTIECKIGESPGITVRIPDFDFQRSDLKEDHIYTLQLTAFADQIDREIPESSDFKTFLKNNGLKAFAVAASITTSDQCYLSARVVYSEVKTNRHTSIDYFYIAGQTQEGIVDIVVSAQTLKELPPVGSLVFGTFHLSGRVQNDWRPNNETPLLQKWFGRKK